VGAITSLALAAIDTALWDLKARRAGEPLWKTAGGAQRSVPVYTTEGGWLHHSVAQLVDEAQGARAQGFRGAKIKVGRPVIAEDVARLAKVREAVGDDFAVMVDANQAFTVAEARRRAHAYAPLMLAWLEEPLPAEDLAGHVELAASASMPIAVGESLYHPSHFREYLERRACSVVQVDCARIGGITPWLKVAHLAEAFNTPVCPHFLMELHVSLTAAVPNGAWVEYIPQLDSITTSRIKLEDGHAVPPDVATEQDRVATLYLQFASRCGTCAALMAKSRTEKPMRSIRSYTTTAAARPGSRPSDWLCACAFGFIQQMNKPELGLARPD